MSNLHRKAWDELTEKDFIHSCDCIVCKSLRDDSGHSCSGCAEHHVANKALRAIVQRAGDVDGLELAILGCPDKPFFGGSKVIARAVSAWLKGEG